MKIALLILFASIVYSVNAQNIHFLKSYGNNGYDYGRDIKQDVDTGYIATGSSSSFSSENADAFLLKVDSLGNFDWSYNYGGTGSDWGESVVVTSDSSYALAGHTNSSGSGGFDFYLVRTSNLGVPLWEKQYGGTDWDKAYDLIQLSDSGFVMVGETYSFGNGNNDAYIIRTDKFGDTLWTRTYGGTEADFANAVIADGDSLIVVGGTESQSNGMTDGLVLKYHIDGTLGWAKNFGQEREDYFTSITHEYGDYFLGGTRHYYFDQTGYLGDFWITQMSTDGNTIYADTSMTGGSHEFEIANDLIVNNLEHIIFAGSTKSFGHALFDNKTDAFIGRLLNNYYETNFIKNFGVAGDENVTALDKCNDNGFVGIGNTKFMSTGGNNIFILKVDKDITTVNITVTTEMTSDVITLSLNENLESNSNLNIYPTLVNETLTIDGLTNENYKIEVYNMNGQLVKSFINQNELNLSDINSGTLIIRLTTSESTITKRIVKI